MTMTLAARNNLVRLLGTDLLIPRAAARAIVDNGRCMVVAPIHAAVIEVDFFDEDGSGSFRLTDDGIDSGFGMLPEGALDAWMASPRNEERVLRQRAEREAEARMHRTVRVIELRTSARWPETIEAIIQDDELGTRVLPFAPVPGEDAQDALHLHSHIQCGDRVRIRVDTARGLDATLGDIPADQECIDWMQFAVAA